MYLARGPFTVEYKGLLDRHAMRDGYLFVPLRPILLSRINFNLIEAERRIYASVN